MTASRTSCFQCGYCAAVHGSEENRKKEGLEYNIGTSECLVDQNSFLQQQLLKSRQICVYEKER